jgi:hypothetical protein
LASARRDRTFITSAAALPTWKMQLAKYQFRLLFLHKGHRALLMAEEVGEQRGREVEVWFRG